MLTILVMATNIRQQMLVPGLSMTAILKETLKVGKLPGLAMMFQALLLTILDLHSNLSLLMQ